MAQFVPFVYQCVQKVDHEILSVATFEGVFEVVILSYCDEFGCIHMLQDKLGISSQDLQQSGLLLSYVVHGLKHLLLK